jgi:signal transduction histidine kinase
MIFRNARRLQRLVEDILDVTKIESDSLNLKREQFNLEGVVQDAINNISNSKEFQHISKSVKIIFDRKIRTKHHDDNNNILVEADKGRIYQVISNLLSNAVKFTEEGVITVSIDTRLGSDDNGNGKQRGQQEEEGGDAVVLVRDSGIGIDPEMFSRLFTKFASKSFEGTGLGLFISKKIIEVHGGKIWAENNENAKGATFGFSLPLPPHLI